MQIRWKDAHVWIFAWLKLLGGLLKKLCWLWSISQKCKNIPPNSVTELRRFHTNAQNCEIRTPKPTKKITNSLQIRRCGKHRLLHFNLHLRNHINTKSSLPHTQKLHRHCRDDAKNVLTKRRLRSLRLHGKLPTIGSHLHASSLGDWMGTNCCTRVPIWWNEEPFRRYWRMWTNGTESGT